MLTLLTLTATAVSCCMMREQGEPVQSERLAVIEGSLCDVVFSPSGTQVACLVQREEDKRYIVVRGVAREGPYDEVGSLTFDRSGKHLAYGAALGGRSFVTVDSRRGADYDEVGSITFSHDGAHLAYVAFKAGRQTVIIDGKESEDYAAVSAPVFMGETGTVVYAAKSDDAWNVVVGGERRVLDFERLSGSVSPSPDGRRVALVGRKAKKSYVKIGDGVSEAFDEVGHLMWRADSSGVVFAGREEERWWIVADGKKAGPYDAVSAPLLNPKDGMLAYGARDGDAEFVVCGGRKGGECTAVSGLQFSPDGCRLAYVCQEEGNPRRGGFSGKFFIVVDGQRSSGPYYGAYAPVFSADSKRLAFIAVVERESRDMVKLVAGGKESELYDAACTPPVFEKGGRVVGMGARRGKEIWWVRVAE